MFDDFDISSLPDDAYAGGEIEFLRKMVDKKPVSQPEPLISQWMEGRRSYPKGSPFPGPHRNNRTPYTIELMDNMSPYSPIQYQDVMKGVQIALTTTAENIIAYFIGECPTEILYVSATEGSLEKWATKRLEPLIDSCGLRKSITDTGHNPKSRKTGDKTFSKNYYGGALDMVSAQSGAKLRSDSKRLVILDEIDGAPILLRTGEGKFTKVAEGRTSAWGERRKIFGLSSPTEFHTSEIWTRYQLGDKRQFLVPCPHCKKHQWLDHETENDVSHGLRRETKAGILVDAYYICDYCHEAIFNYHKNQMFQGGYWAPQITEGVDPLRRSYQISSLYSPAGMFSWMSYWKEYQEAMDTPDGMRAFTNLYKGMPYRETGAKPILQNVIELRGIYTRSSIPSGVLFVTIGLDVQRGSEKDKENPARLELEIVGHGAGYRTWSIDYLVFKGAVDDPAAGAWADLQSYAEEGGFHLKNSNGYTFSPVSIFMDANDNYSTSAVYEFTADWKGAVPIRGANQLKKRKNEKSDKVDENRHGNIKRFRWIKADNDINVVMISTVYYKTLLYRRLKIIRTNDLEQPVGFCDFPLGYEGKYFEGLTAEELLQDGSFHCPSGRRNEPLDCRVYALAAADVFLDAQVTKLRKIAANKGKKDPYIQSINSKTVLQMLEKAIG